MHTVHLFCVIQCKIKMSVHIVRSNCVYSISEHTYLSIPMSRVWISEFKSSRLWTRDKSYKQNSCNYCVCVCIWQSTSLICFVFIFVYNIQYVFIFSIKNIGSSPCLLLHRYAVVKFLTYVKYNILHQLKSQKIFIHINS
jgi:hypothetical protein